MRARAIVVPLLVIAAVLSAVVWAARRPVTLERPADPVPAADDVRAAAARLDELLAARWKLDHLTPAPPADDLQVLRRLSLALHGSVPSLEEIRQFELDAGPDRLLRWTARLLDDRRFADYFSERLARGFVGVDASPFLIFRRDRFKDWLAARLAENLPYDQIVRPIIAEQGLWTGTPATNFVTSTVVDGDVDENKLAGRSVRVFLGQRMDCAQCHDAKFAPWKQSQFEGLAAFFGQTRVTVGGVEDKDREQGRPLEFEVEDRMTLQTRAVLPRVPFHPEWLPRDGTRREQLAGWITHRENRRFERAIANRAWGYLFGRPWHDPVDDLPDPPDADDLLDLLGRDFRAHDCDLRRLILVIASTRAFRLASAHPTEDADEFERLRAAWAMFPMTRLRPEQIIGAMLQGTSVQTVDQNQHLVLRALRSLREKGFVNEYGDLGDAELTEQPGTITQALQRMNSSLSRDIIQESPFNATGRIAARAGSDAACLEVCFLVALTRRPSAEEQAALAPQLAGLEGPPRTRSVEDILWALFNSEEFSWNH